MLTMICCRLVRCMALKKLLVPSQGCSYLSGRLGCRVRCMHQFAPAVPCPYQNFACREKADVSQHERLKLMQLVPSE